MMKKKKVPIKLIDKWLRNVTSLKNTMDQIRSIDPDYNLYLQEDTMHLLNGQSHDSTGNGNCEARQDRSVVSIHIPGAGGGAW